LSWKSLENRSQISVQILTIPAFAFPAEAGTHLLTPEGWKAELALYGWLVIWYLAVY